MASNDAFKAYTDNISSHLIKAVYHKLQLISPGLTQGVLDGLINGGAYIRNKNKTRFETRCSGVDRNMKYVKLKPVNSVLYSNTTVKG